MGEWISRVGIDSRVSSFYLWVCSDFFILQRMVFDWVKERIPMERYRLIRAERASGVALLILGLLQTMKALI